MNLKHIQYVLTVLREGNITAAAKKLYVSQPALSQTIKQAEMLLGAPIFDRTTDPISLTYVGQKYVEAAKQVMMIDSNLHAIVEDTKTETHGRIRLGISIQRGMQLLPLVIPPFVQRYPYVKMDLVEHGSDTLEKLTQEGQCDIALITTSKKPNNLEYVLIENEQLVLMAARTTQLAKRFKHGEAIDINDCKDEKFVSLRVGHSVRKIQDRLFDRHQFTPNILFETNSLEAAKQVAARANALMICPYVYIANSPELLYRVQCHPINNNDYERHFYFAYRKGLYITHYMEDFLQIVREKLALIAGEGHMM